MRRRYHTITYRHYRNEEKEDEPLSVDYYARMVHEPDPEPYESGLFDAQGNPLYVTNEIDQIGFIRRD